MSSASSSGPVAVIFHRLGPYHWARLAAAARSMQAIAIELSAETADYAWEKVHGPVAFVRITVFPDGDSRLAAVWEVRRRVCDALDRCQPVAIAIPGWSDKGALAVLEWGLRNRVPTVLMSESAAQDAPRRPVREAAKRRIVGLYSSALVGGSPHEEYVVQLGLPRERIFIGYDAVDNWYFAERAAEIRNSKSEVRERFGLPGKFFLASARFVEKKNLPRLLQAHARYRELAARLEIGNPKSQMWDLVLLGDGSLRSAILNLRSSLGLDACVHLPGFKQYNDLPAYYGLAGAFVHASTVEQWGLVVNEAMASGLPVLVSNRCGCVPDLVKEGVNGFTFDPYNIEEMAELMLRVSKLKTEALERMGEASRRIIADWGPERFAQGLKQAVDKALEVGPRRPSVVDRLLLKALMFR